MNRLSSRVQEGRGGGGEEVDKAQKKGCQEGVKPVNKRRKQFATTDFRIQGLRELISVKN